MPSTAWSSAASSNTMLAALPPSSSVIALSVPAMARWIFLPISVEPVNATLATSLWVTSAMPISPGPGTMLTTPGGRSAWRQTSANRRADSGVVEAGLRTTVLPAASAGRDLPGQHQQREVPRDDLRGDAERPRDPARERVLELVRPARVVPEVRRRERHVDVAALLDRLARVHRLEDRELARRAPGGCARSGTGTWRARGRAASPQTRRLARVARRGRRLSMSAGGRLARRAPAAARSTGRRW